MTMKTDVDAAPVQPIVTMPFTPYYDVGDYPIGILFDGLNIWTANNLSGNVTKLVD